VSRPIPALERFSIRPASGAHGCAELAQLFGRPDTSADAVPSQTKGMGPSAESWSTTLVVNYLMKIGDHTTPPSDDISLTSLNIAAGPVRAPPRRSMTVDHASRARHVVRPRAKNPLLSSYGQKCSLRRPSFYALINNFKSFSPDSRKARFRQSDKVAGPATLFEHGLHPLLTTATRQSDWPTTGRRLNLLGSATLKHKGLAEGRGRGQNLNSPFRDASPRWGSFGSWHCTLTSA
jgi:hypothetical protein